MSKRTFSYFLFFLGGEEGFLSPRKQKDEQMKEPQLIVFYMRAL